MAIIDSIGTLRELAAALPRPEYPWEEKPRFTAAAAESQIQAFELAAGFSIPSDVTDFFGHVGDIIGMSIHNGYWLGGITKLIALSRETDFPRVHNNDRIMPIATDGGGNAFLFSEAGTILNWRHETGEFLEISPAFERFLELVTDDWRAFVSSTPGWRYLV